MDITTVPFTRHTGIEQNDNGSLGLAFHPHVKNHVGTMHASTQFALAETASGVHLLSLFPEFEHDVIPVLR